MFNQITKLFNPIIFYRGFGVLGFWGFVGSDDELSLCASDHENDDNIQCNVISSCFDQETESVTETFVSSQKDTINNESSSPMDCVNNELSREPLETVVQQNDQTEEAKTDEISLGSMTREDENLIINDPPSSSYTTNTGSSSSHVTEALNEAGPSTSSVVIDEEVAGPSGYSSRNIHQSGSESSSSDSVIEIDAPQGKIPRTLSLITDSDESENGVPQSGKQKFRKKKKKRTVKEKLSKQEGLMDEREDLQDLNCSVCLGPFEDRTFLKQCFHILFIHHSFRFRFYS